MAHLFDPVRRSTTAVEGCPTLTCGRPVHCTPPDAGMKELTCRLLNRRASAMIACYPCPGRSRRLLALFRRSPKRPRLGCRTLALDRLWRFRDSHAHARLDGVSPP